MLVKVHVICALARMFVAGMVSTVPANVPKLVTGLPDAAALASKQLAEVITKFVATVSVMVTAVPVAVAGIGGGEVGAGVPAVAVVMAAGVEARLVEENVNGPPDEPSVVF